MNSNPGDDGSLYDPARPTSPPEVIPTAHPTTLPPGDILQCHRIDVDYELWPSLICAMCCVFGILYTFFGMWDIKSLNLLVFCIL